MIIGSQVSTRIALGRYFRRERLLLNHQRTFAPTPNIGNTGCPDERCHIEEIGHTKTIQQLDPVLNPLLGGGMRFSPHFPIPISFYQETVAPKYRPGEMVTVDEIVQWDREEVEVAVRNIIKASSIRGFSVYKLDIHGPHCGWADLCGLGLIQQIWLVIDARRELKALAAPGRWQEPEFEIYCTYHEHFPNGGRIGHKTYLIDKSHRLFRQYSSEDILGLTDEEFLERHAPDLAAKVRLTEGLAEKSGD